MDESKERRLLVVRGCMLFIVLISWAIFFAYLFSIHRALETNWWDIVGAVFFPSLLVLFGTALACGLVYLVYRTALIKIR